MLVRMDMEGSEKANISWNSEENSILTPGSDYYMTSPYNIHTISGKQVKRILKLIW